jgi:hypothetical protein
MRWQEEQDPSRQCVDACVQQDRFVDVCVGMTQSEKSQQCERRNLAFHTRHPNHFVGQESFGFGTLENI